MLVTILKEATKQHASHQIVESLNLDTSDYNDSEEKAAMFLALIYSMLFVWYPMILT